MNRIALSIMCIASVVMIGCTTMPQTADEMYTKSETVGYTTGIMMSMSKSAQNPTNRTIVVNIVSEIDDYIPETNMTCETLWMPIASNNVAKAVSQKKITDYQGVLILNMCSIITRGSDFMLYNKYKEAVEKNREMIPAAIHGFVAGFKKGFPKKVSVSSSVDPTSDAHEIDEDVKEYLKSSFDDTL